MTRKPREDKRVLPAVTITAQGREAYKVLRQQHNSEKNNDDSNSV